jgi:hypothetical protein
MRAPGIHQKAILGDLKAEMVARPFVEAEACGPAQRASKIGTGIGETRCGHSGPPRRESVAYYDGILSAFVADFRQSPNFARRACAPCSRRARLSSGVKPGHA